MCFSVSGGFPSDNPFAGVGSTSDPWFGANDPFSQSFRITGGSFQGGFAGSAPESAAFSFGGGSFGGTGISGSFEIGLGSNYVPSGTDFDYFASGAISYDVIDPVSIVVGMLTSAGAGPAAGAALRQTGALEGLGSVGGLSDDIARTFVGRIREVTLKSDVTAFRIFGGRSTFGGRAEGVFLTTRRFVGSGARQTLSLPPGNLASNFGLVRIPAGARTFIGRAAPQEFVPGQVLSGRGTQIFVRDKSALLFGPTGILP